MSKPSYEEELLKMKTYRESKYEGTNDTESEVRIEVDAFTITMFYMLENIRERLTRIEARQDLIVKAIKNKKG